MMVFNKCSSHFMIVVSAAQWQSFRDGDSGGLSETDMVNLLVYQQKIKMMISDRLNGTGTFIKFLSTHMSNNRAASSLVHHLAELYRSIWFHNGIFIINDSVPALVTKMQAYHKWPGEAETLRWSLNGFVCVAPHNAFTCTPLSSSWNGKKKMN